MGCRRVSVHTLLKLMGFAAVALIVLWQNLLIKDDAGVDSPITKADVDTENKPAVSKLERQFNRVVTDYDSHLKKWLDLVVSEKRAEDDPSVVGLVRELLEPPSQHLRKTSRPIEPTAQSNEIMKILGHKKGGWYVEVGGLDGERGSNTLWLEAKMGWQGLLIEMDPFFYTMLKGHNRYAWSINACLSPYNYPILMKYKESMGGGGQLVDEANKVKNNRATTQVVSEVPCFPFYSIMLALNQTKVDYFSLDVEGFELDILRTIPYDKLDIKTFSVEYVHGRERGQAYLDYMNANGYRMAKEIHIHDTKMAIHVDDYIFEKNIS